MLTMNDLFPLLGRRTAVATHEGDTVGTIGEVFLDDATDEPTWITVHTGLFGTRESFVPLRGASVQADRLVVGYPSRLIRHAPSRERNGHLSREDESALYRHYGLAGPVAAAGGEPAAGRAPADGREAGTPDGSDGGQPWMIRSEERLRVGTESYEAARVRLRKYVVTEEVTQTVPLRREELRIEREPIAAATVDTGTADGLFQEEVVELVGRAEHAVVSKETVAVERVRFSKATVPGRATVTEQVRKERIATNVGDLPGARGTVPGTRAPAGDNARKATGRASAGRSVFSDRPGSADEGSADEGSANIVRNTPNAILKGRNKRR